MAAAKIEERVCEDMISALPDDLLVMILLLLPIKDAVATMILSKRWRFVWTMLPTLEYEENSFYCDDKESKKSIWWFFKKSMKLHRAPRKRSIWLFLEKSMELHRAPVLQNLLIKLGPECPIDADVGKCLTKAVDRGVVVLNFELCRPTGPTRLPKSLYTCETLKELTLSHKLLVDFPSSSCLPSLLDLDLFYVVYKDEASLIRFLSSCPVLKTLIVKRNKNHDNVTKFSVKVPSLELFVYDSISFAGDDVVVDTGRCLVIDTPALKNVLVADYSRDSWSFENVTCLEKACILVESFPDIDKSKASLYGVSSLTLYTTHEVLVRCSTIKFSRLIELKLKIPPFVDSDWLEPLLLLLQNAPKVKDLLVYNALTSYENPIPLSWNQSSSIPECISSNLEIFESIDYGDKNEEKEFLTYILANSKCLKTAIISMRPDLNIKKRKLIIKKLRKIPRTSTTSQLLFK